MEKLKPGEKMLWGKETNTKKTGVGKKK